MRELDERYASINKLEETYILPVSEKGQFTLPQSIVSLFDLPYTKGTVFYDNDGEKNKVCTTILKFYFVDPYQNGSIVMYPNYPCCPADEYDKELDLRYQENEYFNPFKRREHVIDVTSISGKNLVLIPKAIREILNLEAGDMIGLHLLPNYREIHEFNDFDALKTRCVYREEDLFLHRLLIYNASKTDYNLPFSKSLSFKKNQRDMSDFLFSVVSLKEIEDKCIYVENPSDDYLYSLGRLTSIASFKGSLWDTTDPGEFFDQYFPPLSYEYKNNTLYSNSYAVVVECFVGENSFLIEYNAYYDTSKKEPAEKHSLVVHYGTVPPEVVEYYLDLINKQYRKIKAGKNYKNALLQPDLKDIVCQFELKVPETLPLYGSRYKNKNLELYCNRTAFNFECSEDIKCCRECHMLQKTYEMLMKILPKENKSELRAAVKSAKFFLGDAGPEECEACDGSYCKLEGAPEVCNMIRYYFYECMIADKNRLVSGKQK